MAGDDFVQVQLTAAGIEQAAGAPLRISQDRRAFVFAPGESVRVERSFEWNHILARYVSPHTGLPLFELAPADEPKTSKTSKAAKTSAATEVAAATQAKSDLPSPAPVDPKETAE